MKKTSGTRFTASLFFHRLETAEYPLIEGTVQDHFRAMGFLDNEVSVSEMTKINKLLEGARNGLVGVRIFPRAYHGKKPRWAKGHQTREAIVPEVIERNRAEIVDAFHALFPKTTREEMDAFVAYNQKNPEANAICRMLSDKLESLAAVEESQKRLLESKDSEVEAVKENIQLLRLAAPQAAPPVPPQRLGGYHPAR